MNKSIIILAFSTLVFPAQSATIKGKVLDEITKDRLTGATVYIDNTKISDVVALDGSYSLKNVPVGNYIITVQLIGYVKQEKPVEIKSTDDALILNISMKQNEIMLKEATVEATQDKESDSYSRSREKNADNLINAVSARSIELSPDITVGDVLRRVSGLIIAQNPNGGNQLPIIRGMDARYNYTMIDGIKIPSPDNQNRYVSMDIFPAEIIERLEVNKTLTADMEGDAIGGALNLVLKNAPDQFTFNANASTGYSQTLFDRSYMAYNSNVINDQSPSQVHPGQPATLSDFPLGDYDYYKKKSPSPDILAGFTIGNRFLNHKLGILISTSYQNTYGGSSGIFIVPSAQPTPTNQPIFDDVQVRSYSYQQTREAIHLKTDYEFSRKHKISFYTLYTSLNTIRQRQFSDTILSINAGEVDQHYETRVTDQSIYNATLHGEDTLVHNLGMDWSLAYSLASGSMPDNGTLVTTGATSGAGTWQSFSRQWTQNTDQDLSGYLNLNYQLNLLGLPIELKTGGMYRSKTRINHYDDYNLLFTPNQQVNSIENAQFSVADPLGTANDFNNYTIQENVSAVYGMVKLKIAQRLKLLGGVRMENTSMMYSTGEPITIPGQNGSTQYSDILPSGVINYSINEKQNIRASYFASISRPSFYEYIPGTIVGEYYNIQGNPYLLHTQADNYDLRYDFFPNPSDQLLVGVFYKNITDPIEWELLRISISDQNLKPVNITTPATNYGFELAFTKYIKEFGVSANYTYTKSQVTLSKFLQSTGQNVSETNPLQGQADNIANLSLLYKNQNIGLDLKLSGVYTGKLISQVSPDFGLDQWQMPMTRLDFSFEKSISKKNKITIFGKVNNILNAATTVRIFQPNPYTTPGPYWLPMQDDSKNSILIQKGELGQAYFLGIRYKI